MALWVAEETISRDKFNQKSVFVGTSAPATTFAGQVWVDTSSNLVKFRNSADNAWIITTTGHTYAPVGIEFGSATQEYDISGNTWVSAAAGGTLGGIPNGDLAGCLTAIATSRDGAYLNVREKTGAASATNPLTVQFLFTNVLNFDTIRLRSYYSGSVSHHMRVQLWNYSTSAWDTFAIFSGETDYIDRALTVFNHSVYVNGGNAKLQLIHTDGGLASHSLQFDYVALGIGSGTGGITLASSVSYTGAGIFATKTNVQTALDEINTTYLDQAVKQASSPTFAGLTIYKIGSVGLPTLTMQGYDSQLIMQKTDDVRDVVFMQKDTAGTLTYIDIRNGKITLAGDTNLYRSAASTLKTDDSFEVVGQITSSTSGTYAFQGKNLFLVNDPVNAFAQAIIGTKGDGYQGTITFSPLYYNGATFDFVERMSLDYTGKLIIGGALTVAGDITTNAKSWIGRINDASAAKITLSPANYSAQFYPYANGNDPWVFYYEDWSTPLLTIHPNTAGGKDGTLTFDGATATFTGRLVSDNAVVASNSGNYKLTLEAKDNSADAFIGHNAYYSSGYEGNALKLKWDTSHGSFGSRGIIFSFLEGIVFYADNVASTANTEFSPTIRMTLTNAGQLNLLQSTNSTAVRVNGGLQIGDLAGLGAYLIFGQDGQINNALRGVVFSKDGYAPYPYRWGKHTINEVLKADASNWTELMSLDNAGNLTVGPIGTNQFITIQGPNTAGETATLNLIDTNNYIRAIHTGAFELASYSTFAFYTNNAYSTVKMSLDASGNLTVAGSLKVTAHQLYLAGSTDAVYTTTLTGYPAFGISHYGDTTYGAMMFTVDDWDSNPHWTWVKSRTGGVAMALFDNGDLHVAGWIRPSSSLTWGIVCSGDALLLAKSGVTNGIIVYGSATGNYVTGDGSIAGSTWSIIGSKTPANATAAGTTGMICWDASYVYVCTATNTWKRAGIATW
jgi:hypothetical protein